MEISRFPCKRLLRMPGSTTTRGRHVSCDIDTRRVAFCGTENISTPNLSYAAQYLACALPCERFTSALAGTRASLGASAVRYSFTVTDFHRLPFAGLPAHPSIHGPLLPRTYAPTCLHLAKADIRALERRAGFDRLQPPSDPRHRYGATAIAEISAIGDRVPLRWSSVQSANTLAFRYFGALTGADRSSVATAVGPVRSCCAFVLIHLALLFI
jgi:hypothetical protein